MPKASEVASALRNLADHLDADPDADIPQVFVSWSSLFMKKEQFLALAKLLPRPLKKKIDDSSSPKIRISYETNAIDIWVAIEQSKTCRLIKPAMPAVYDCEPLLSPEEEEQIVAETAAVND